MTALVAFSGTFAVAQTTDVVTVTPNVAIPDDGYDGSLASMACADLDFSASAITNITDVSLTTALDHTWVGDLVVKVVDPGGDVLTVLSRPVFAEPGDDGTGCCGDSSNLVSTAPVAFFDGAPKDAETMGDESTSSLYNICAEDPFNCEYFPNPGAGPGTSFAQFDGQAAAGVWQVCVGDSAGGDPSTFASATLAITGETDGTPGCLQEITATVSDPTPSPGDRVMFTFTVTNNGAGPATHDLWLSSEGPEDRTRLWGSGTIGPGETVTRSHFQLVPASITPGTYDVSLNIGDFGSLSVCDSADFTFTFGVAREGEPFATKAEAEAAEAAAPAPARVPSNPEALVFEGGGLPGDLFATAAPASSASAPVGVSPNPFGRQATIRYEVAEAAPVRLAVYDVLGREVAVLVDARQEAGTHSAVFEASDLAAGTYVYRLVVGREVQTGRMTLAR